MLAQLTPINGTQMFALSVSELRSYRNDMYMRENFRYLLMAKAWLLPPDVFHSEHLAETKMLNIVTLTRCCI